MALRPRYTQKNNPESLRETCGGKPADKRQGAYRRGKGQDKNLFLPDNTEKGTRVNQKFTDKPVKRRQSGYGDRPNQKSRAGNGHFFQQSPQQVHFASVGLPVHGPGAHEQEPFKQRMIDNMQ